MLIGAFSLGNTAPNVQSFSVARGAAYVVYNLIELVSVNRSILSRKCSPKCAVSVLQEGQLTLFITLLSL